MLFSDNCNNNNNFNSEECTNANGNSFVFVYILRNMYIIHFFLESKENLIWNKKNTMLLISLLEEHLMEFDTNIKKNVGMF